MRDDPLRNLLREADGGATPLPRPLADLPQRVYRRHRRRRLSRSAALGVLLLCAAVIGVLLEPEQHRQLATSQPTHRYAEAETNQADLEAAHNAMLALDTHAALYARTANMLTARERRRDRLEKSLVILDGDDPTDVVRRQKHEFALARVFDADRLLDRPDRAEDAVRIYQQTIDLFPGTPAADIAAKRLDHLRT